MKKILVPVLFIFSVVAARAQVTSLHENFDVSCATSMGFPVDWTSYNTISGTVPQGAWTCGAGAGNDGTPGMMCSGTYGVPPTYHEDTAYLITPLLDISTVTGPLYLRFDTKISKLHLGGKLTLVVAQYPDSVYMTPVLDTDITLAMLPVFGSADSAGWVTHEVSLALFEGSAKFYFAFRYASNDTTGSTFYLDNVNTTTIGLGVANLNTAALPLTVIGNSLPEEVTISYNTEMPGIYHLMIYDLMGRVVYNEALNTDRGAATHKISGLNLRPGMYLVKMGNENTYGTAKFVVQ